MLALQIECTKIKSRTGGPDSPMRNRLHLEEWLELGDRWTVDDTQAPRSTNCFRWTGRGGFETNDDHRSIAMWDWNGMPILRLSFQSRPKSQFRMYVYSVDRVSAKTLSGFDPKSFKFAEVKAICKPYGVVGHRIDERHRTHTCRNYSSHRTSDQSEWSESPYFLHKSTTVQLS